MVAVFYWLTFRLVDQKGGVKISDFGISKKVEDGKSTGELYSASFATDIKKANNGLILASRYDGSFWSFSQSTQSSRIRVLGMFSADAMPF